MAADRAAPRLPAAAFARQDEGDDTAFYQVSRLVTHIDAAAIAALTDFYRRILPAGGALLDLMSSWVSHLPADVAYGEVVGHGMNPEELSANPRLSRWFVRDLNRDPALPLGDDRFDAAMICVSIQYLTAPVAVLEEASRVLRPGAPLVIGFSNRCFPTKAVAVWLGADRQGHARLTEIYLRAAGFTDILAHDLMSGSISDPLTVVVGKAR